MSTTYTNYNSDLGTYDLFKQLEQQFDHYITSSTWRNEPHYPSLEITSDFVRRTIYPKMKQEAEILAEKIGRSSANRTERWGSARSTTLVHRIIEVLFSNGIRRSSIPSEEKLLHKREILIRNGLTSDNGLRFSILMLPNRDRNKAKNDGYLPDLGEVISLLQLWTIVKAMLIATEQFAQLLIGIFKKIDASVKTVADVQKAVQTMLTAKTTTVDCSLQKQHSSVRFERLREELNNGYNVINEEKVELLLQELARCNRTMTWFAQSITEVIQVQTKSIHLFVVQDARRYACYDTDLDEHIQAYTRCLNQIVVELNINEYIILTSHEQLEQECAHQDLQMFLQQRAEVYSDKFEKFSEPFIQAKSDLMCCTSRENFLATVDKLSLNKSISQLIEPILHSRYHPELDDVQFSSSNELKILAQIYEPQTSDANRESVRQKLLFSSLINATKYVCSYESQTSTKNDYQLDDIQFLLPGTVRLSIHNKSPDCEQFLIKCGPNLHRQPWHGTVGLRLRKNKGPHSMSFEVRLSFEYKVDKYTPVFVKKDSMITNNHHHDHLSALARIDQPIVWIHPDLAHLYFTNDNDSTQIFDKNNKIRLI
jgi:pyoverdine/dityrosine biosynthesis protein Dit1